eukprot:m.484938 g.484938  ORF g.484938 m.484938 type:complete len:538 (-) comp23603_c0_seq1:252-1865(-)
MAWMLRAVTPVVVAIVTCMALGSVAAANDGAKYQDDVAAKKPNILFIVADDLGFNDVEFNHGAIDDTTTSLVHTPNLLKVAKRGVVFTNHHVQPFCSPTRAALMTGRYVLRYGLQNTVIWPQDAYAVPKNETLLAGNLKDAGYYTAAFGKWHLGLYQRWAVPTGREFDEQYGYYLGGEDYWTHSRNGGLDWHRNATLETSENGTYSATLLGDAAVDYIYRRSQTNQPWFLYLPFQSVHSPMEAPEKYINQYQNLTGNVRIRAAMVTAMDDQIGRILAELESTQQLENTIIAFTADNGAPYADAFSMGDEPEMVEAMQLGYRPLSSKPKPVRPPPGPHGQGGGSNSPLSGWKHWNFEGGVRSAAFISWSGLKNPGTFHHGLFHAVDWLPTLVGMAGGNTKRNLPLDGVDILAAIQAGGNTSPRDEIPVNIAACGQHSPRSIVDGPQAAVISKINGAEMKLIVDCYWRGTHDIADAQLYNLTADPSETANLKDERPHEFQKLLSRMAFWEAQSVPPYSVEKSCGEGKPQGTPPHWDVWC